MNLVSGATGFIGQRLFRSLREAGLPCVGLALVIGGGVAAIVRVAEQGLLRPALARVAMVALVGLYAGLALLTWQQVETWRDTDSLWRNAAEAEPEWAKRRIALVRGGVPCYSWQFYRAIGTTNRRTQFRFK